MHKYSDLIAALSAPDSGCTISGRTRTHVIFARGGATLEVPTLGKVDARVLEAARDRLHVDRHILGLKARAHQRQQ